jgi:hypothetical protein
MNPLLRVAPPRHYISPAPAAPILPGPGLPQDRHARIAARRSFVEMKQRFMAAVHTLDGLRGDWLRRQVRHAHEPIDLWLLRGAVFAALGLRDETTRRTRDELHRVLDSVFPDNGELLPYGLPL